MLTLFIFLSILLGGKTSQPVIFPEVPIVRPIAGDCESFAPLLSKYDWDIKVALEIAKKESGCDPSNDNLKDSHRAKNGSIICYGSFGFFNVGCLHYEPGEDKADLELNIKKSYDLYIKKGRHFYDWTTCSKIKDCL